MGGQGEAWGAEELKQTKKRETDAERGNEPPRARRNRERFSARAEC